MANTVQVPAYEVREQVQLDPSRTALIVIDMQNDFVKEGGALRVAEAAETVPCIRHLLALARECGMKVAYSQDTHGEGDPEWKIWGEHARRGTWGWEIVEELRPREDEPVLEKVRYDAFYGTHLDHLLRAVGRRHARDLRHCGKYLRALHGRQRRPPLVQGGDPKGRRLGAGAVRPRILPAPDGLPLRGHHHYHGRTRGRPPVARYRS
jgi:Isochorismatase family